MIHIWVGNTGQGKSYMTSMDTLFLLERNKKWFEKGKTKIKRRVVTNLSISAELKQEYSGYYFNWQDMEQLVQLRECDIIFDDMSAYLDSQRWQDTPMSVKRWLRLHEHYGCDIYGNAQDFLTIDPSVRRLTGGVTHVIKAIGSRRPSATKPEVKFIWGLLVCREVSEELYDKEKIKYEYSGMPELHWIRRKICNVFDTTQDLDIGEFPPLKHIERSCNTCGKIIAKHV